MRAEIISVGTELLLGQIVDTNAAHLSRILSELGIDLHYRSTVGDNAARLTEALRMALSRADVVFTIGGLGPTQDDLTRETVAAVVGDEMMLDDECASRLRAFFKARGVMMPETNLKQAMVPTKGRALPNPLGTAPGAVFETEDGRAVITLPGPPREFAAMLESAVVPYLRERAGANSQVIRSRVLRVAGLGESSVEEKIKHLLAGQNPTLAPYASPGEVKLRITAKAASAEEAEAMLDTLDREIIAVLGDFVYGRDDQTLEQVVVEGLRSCGLTLATAESCTGGLISSMITDVPGSSEVFLAGVVSYSNTAKVELLGVPQGVINRHGAVSKEAAEAMAEGVRRVSHADIGLSVTGIAGPSGGTPNKPVGLVYIAVSSESGTSVTEHRFSGSRLDVKQRTSQAALDALRALLRQAAG